MKTFMKTIFAVLGAVLAIMMLVIGPQVTALAAQPTKPISSDCLPSSPLYTPLCNRSELQQPGRIIRQLDAYGRPDYTKPYWKVNQKGELIQYVAGTNRRSAGGQNYRVEGGTIKPIDKYGRVQPKKPALKLNDR